MSGLSRYRQAVPNPRHENLGGMTNRSRRVVWVTAVTFAVAVGSRALVFAIPGYRELYVALPEVLRWLEQPVRWALICAVGLYFGAGVGPRAAAAELGLARSPLRGLGFGFLATLPMLVGALAFGRPGSEETALGLAFGAAVWPLAEEVLYRGYAFGQLHRRGGLALWPAAFATGLLFGLVHLGQASVRKLPLGGEIGTVAVVAVGGLLFAWLYARWEFDLWVPFALHGFMNLWWSLFSLADNPLGGWLPNLLRLLTVLLAVGLTLARGRIPWLRGARG